MNAARASGAEGPLRARAPRSDLGGHAVFGGHAQLGPRTPGPRSVGRPAGEHEAVDHPEACELTLQTTTEAPSAARA